MNIMKKIGVFAVAAVSVLAMASCGAEPSVEAILEEAQKQSQAVKSMDYTITADMEMKSGDEAVSMVMTGDASCFTDPMKLKMTMNMDMGELGSQAVDVYAEEADGKFITYSGVSGNWIKQEVDSLQQYDGVSNMKIYLDSADSVKMDGEEELQSGTAYKLSGVISGDSIEKVINASGIMDSMTGQLGAEYGEMLKSMYSDMGDLPMTIWVSKKDNYPVKYKMDMTAMMSQMMNKLMEQMGSETQGVTIEVNKMVMEMEMKNVNAATDFEIPQEAKDAPLIGV